MIALLEAHRSGLLRREHWPRNLVAGLVVGVVALPLAMAFAIASGAKPEQGLYTAIVAGLAVSMFGGSRLQIAGPTGAFVVILSGVTARYGIDGLIGLIPVAALIGQGGLGQLMRDGFERDFRTPLTVGVVLTVAFAIACDFIVLVIQRLVTPWSRGTQ